MKIVYIALLACLAGLTSFSQARPATPSMHQSMSMPQDAPAREPFMQTSASTGPKTVVYHLYITDTVVNYTGHRRRAIAVNGSLPGPTLTFTEGDTALIYVHNEMMMATSVHWHGLIVPNRYDGVSYLT